MKNLVMGTALNYDAEKIKPFVKSLRKHYDGEILFLVGNTNQEFDELLNEFVIQTYKIPNSTNQDEICSVRHRYYKQVIEAKNYDKIMLSDVRDVVFQDDPFNHQMDTDLEFFLEPGLYKNCECHRHWFCDLNIHGSSFYEKVHNEYIVCAGTTIGTKTGMISYLNKMIEELSNKFEELNRIITDQPTHAYMIYSGYFPNHRKYRTLQGPIATLSSNIDLKFDFENNLLNEDGSIVAAIHQWDRSNRADIFYNKAMS